MLAPALDEWYDICRATAAASFDRTEGLRLLHSTTRHASDFLPFYPMDLSAKQVINSGKAPLIGDIKEHRHLTPSGWSGYQDGSVLVFPIPG